jgi:hypothetical protein
MLRVTLPRRTKHHRRNDYQVGRMLVPNIPNDFGLGVIAGAAVLLLFALGVRWYREH